MLWSIKFICSNKLTSNTFIGSGSLLSYAGSSSTVGYNSGLGYQSEFADHEVLLGAKKTPTPD